MKHSIEPWQVGKTESPEIFLVIDSDGRDICKLNPFNHDRANAARIVACVNFCAAVGSDWLTIAGTLGGFCNKTNSMIESLQSRAEQAEINLKDQKEVSKCYEYDRDEQRKRAEQAEEKVRSLENKLEEAEYTTVFGAFKERDSAVNCADLMRDEFQRIISTVKCNTDWHNASEILGICERAIGNINQTVPVIVQRDELEMVNQNLKQSLESSRAATSEFLSNPYNHWSTCSYRNEYRINRECDCRLMILRDTLLSTLNKEETK